MTKSVRTRWIKLRLSLWLLLATLAGPGCALSRQETSFSPLSQGEGPGVKGVIFSVDGAGGFEGTSAQLQQVVADTHVPLCVMAVPWTHGFGRVLADQIGWQHA